MLQGANFYLIPLSSPLTFGCQALFYPNFKIIRHPRIDSGPIVFP